MNSQQLFNVLWIASIYGLFAVGLNLIMGVAHVLNLAHAAVFTWGALAGWQLVAVWELPVALGVVAAAAVGALLGAVLELLVFRPLRRRGADELTEVIASIGALIVLESAARTVSEAGFLTFPEGTVPRGTVELGPLVATSSQLVIIVTAVVLVALLTFFLRRSRQGMDIRASAYSSEIAQMHGIHVPRVYLLTIVLGSAIAGISGFLLGWTFNQVHYQMGELLVLRGIAIIILGGFGSVAGAFLAALVLAAGEVLAVVYLAPSVQEMVAFVLLILVLLVRPEGLLPTTQEDRA